MANALEQRLREAEADAQMGHESAASLSVMLIEERRIRIEADKLKMSD